MSPAHIAGKTGASQTSTESSAVLLVILKRGDAHNDLCLNAPAV